MADSISLNVSVDGIGQKLQAMLDRAGLVQGWLNRVAYPMIVEAQRMRWASEGASEGEVWEPLNETYAAKKLRKFASFPGGGRKMLIATGRLVDGVTGDNTTDHYKLVGETKLEVGTTVPYAKFVDEKRNFTDLSSETVGNIAAALGTYIREGNT